MDPLSDLLRAVRLDGAYFYMVDAIHPWSVFAMASRDSLPRVLPGSEHLIPYHILTSGACWAGIAGEPQVLLQPGDAIVFARGDSHVVSSEVHRGAAMIVGDGSPNRYLKTVRLGNGPGARATLVCGFLGCDVLPYNPLIDALPRSMHIPGAAGGWLSEFPRQVVTESQEGRTGSGTMLTRMAELMFIEVVRRYVETLGENERGWLSGLRDPVVGPALTQLHSRPSHQWTLAELARTVAASRTVLSERFTSIVGVPPMQYLTRWRLQLAAEQLVRGTDKVAAVGAGVGYESEAAFSRAFKRATGVAPAAWRRARSEAGRESHA